MKRITPQNWLKSDATGAMAGVDPLAWRDAMLAISLDDRVPEVIAAMFETARGSVIYGGFFAPLVTLGVEHCYWVLEAGVRARCAQLGLPVAFQDKQGKDHVLSFGHNLRQLTDKGVIAPEDDTLWRQAGELREWASLPKHLNLVGPEHASTALTRAATLLNKLFA
jgi:hypothetical protein